MDGLRRVGVSPEFPLTFDGRGFESPAVTITASSNGTQPKSHHVALRETDLPHFFHDDSSTPAPKPSLRLASISVAGPGHILVSQTTFSGIFRALGADPWVEHLLRTLPYGFHHSPSSSSFNTTYFLGTSFVWSLWITHAHPPSLGGGSSTCTTKCLILNPAGARFSTTSASNLAVGGESFRHLQAFFKTLEAFEQDAHSALCLPFVFAVNAFRWREQSILSVLDVVRAVESKTGHGSWGSGRFEETRDAIPKLTAELGQAGNTVANTVKHLGILGEVLGYLEPEVEQGLGGGRRSEADESFVAAVRILRRQCVSLREQCRYLEGRIKNQSSVLFAFLTHEDSKINIEVANASMALAEATAKDSSSMKTIAILTMAFLPATFFAALFSVPSMGWSDPDKFATYWACTIPVTAVTFIIWAALTQREALKVVLRRVRQTPHTK